MKKLLLVLASIVSVLGADIKVSQLTELTSPGTGTSYLLLVDTSATPQTRKVLMTNIVVRGEKITGTVALGNLPSTLATDAEVVAAIAGLVVGDGLTNSAGTVKIALVAGANITLSTNNGQITVTGSASGSGGIVNTVINTGASLNTAVPIYNDLTGTNVIPSKITITAFTNLNVGALTVTNKITYPAGVNITNAGNGVSITNDIPVIMNSNLTANAGITVNTLTNSGLTASQLIGTDANKKVISVPIGDGLTNNAGTLSVAITGGANITLTTNNNRITIAGAASGTGAIVNTVLNTGTPIVTALPEYLDVTGTNIGPGKITIVGLTNLTTGDLTSTNGASFGNGTTVATIKYSLGGNITNAGNNVTLTNDIPYIFNSNVTVNATINATTLQQGGVGVPTTARNLIAGAGLSGGGTLAADRTFTLDTSTFIGNVTYWDASQATRTWTANLSGATDPVWTYGNNSADLSTGVLKQGATPVALSTTTLTFLGTANEITSSAGAQDLSANRTWTFSLPTALTFTGKTVTGGTFSSPTIGTPTITGAISFPDGVRQTFNPDATVSGLNVGAQAGDPSTLVNGDIFYDSTGNLLRARINGATVSLGAGGGGGSSYPDISVLRQTVVIFDDMAETQGSGSASWGPFHLFRNNGGTGSTIADLGGETNAPGITRFNGGTLAGTSFISAHNFGSPSQAPWMIRGTWTNEIRFRFNINQAAGTDEYRGFLGFGTANNGTDGTDSIGLQYSITNANFIYITRSNSVTTATSSALAFNTNWNKLRTVTTITAGTPNGSVVFTLNDANTQTVTATIPVSRIVGLQISMFDTVGTTSKSLDIDYIYLGYGLELTR